MGERGHKSAHTKGMGSQQSDCKHGFTEEATCPQEDSILKKKKKEH